MKNIIPGILMIFGLLVNFPLFSQGWVAEVEIDLNHELYAYERIESASFTFSGVAISGNSSTSRIHFALKGTGPASGEINLRITGVGFEPYDSDNPYSQPLFGQFSGNYKIPCTTGSFISQNPNSHQQILIRITFYPRLVINDFVQDCDQLTLTTSTCYPALYWEVSEDLTGNFKRIPEKTNSQMSITLEELSAIGFDSPYGRKYFRVTGIEGTTSQLQAVDMYYPGPTAIINSTPPKCHDGTDGSIRIEISSPDEAVINDYVITLHAGVPPEMGIRQIYINGGVAATFNDIPAGLYWVRIENNSNGIYGSCWTDYSVQPIINPEPVTINSFETSSYHGYAIKCNGGNEGTLKVNASGGTGSYSEFVWTPDVSATNTATGLYAGVYSIKVRDSNGCSSNAYSRTLTEPRKLSVNLISTGGKNGFDVSCGDKSDGAIVTQLSGGVAPYTYAWSNGSTEQALTGVGTGTYGVMVTDGNGCTSTQTRALNSPDPIGFTIAELAGITCSGDRSGVLEGQSVSNAIGPVSYAWSSGETNREIVNKPAGTYSLTISDEQGCSTTKEHILKEPVSYKVHLFASSDYNGSAIRCHGEANGELTSAVKDDNNNVVIADYYTWYRNGTEAASGSAMSKLNALAEGTYRVSIRYKNACSAETTFELVAPSPVATMIQPTSDYNGVPISCSGKTDGNLRASALGGTGDDFTFTWASGVSGPDLRDVGQGTYVVTGRDKNGCEGQAEKILNAPSAVEATIAVLSNYHGQAISCFGAADAIIKGMSKGGTPPYKYAWHSGDTTQHLTDIRSGYYSLRVSDANGCNGEADTTVQNPEPVRARIQDISSYNGYGVSCYGSEDGFILAGGTGGAHPYKYRWNGSSNTQPGYNKLKPGTYTVMVSDQNGCRDSTRSIISQPPPLQLQVPETKHISCHQGKDGEMQLQAKGGVGNYFYSIDNHEPQNSPVFPALVAKRYELAVTDGNGCTQQGVHILHEPKAIVINFQDMVPALCGDPEGSVSAVVTGGTGSYRFEWQDSKAKVISDEARLEGLSSGVYTVHVLDENHCESTRSVGITTTDGPVTRITDVLSPTCSYSLDGAASVEVVSGTGPFLFLWQDGQTETRAVNLSKGTHLVQVTDSNNCTAVESVLIVAPDSLEIVLTEKNNPACFGECNGKIRVSARGGDGDYRYSWKDAIGPEVTGLCEGSYKVNVDDGKGCNASQNFYLTDPEPLVIRLVTATSPSCENGCNGKLEVAASGGTGLISYDWLNGANGALIDNLCAGSHTVSVSDVNNCIVTEILTLVQPETDKLNLGTSITLCVGQTHTLDAGPQWQDHSWSGSNGFRSKLQRITIADAGAYWLEAVSAMGCVVLDTFLVQTSMDLLQANFLLTTEAVPGDTVVIIDVSWPLPDQITWNLPQGMVQLEDHGDILFGRFEHAGDYDVSLTARLGECRDDVTKSIRISDGIDFPEDGRLGHKPFVKKFSLYPNPNNGAFDIEVEFLEVSPLMLSVWNSITGKKVTQIDDHAQQTVYLKHIDIGSVSAGPYTLRLDHIRGTKYLRFIVR